MAMAAEDGWPPQVGPTRPRAARHGIPGGGTDGRCRPWPRLAGAAGLVLPCLLACMPAVRAQDQPAPPPALAETIPPGAVIRLLGRDVTGPGGQVVAQIVNVLVDAAGRPQAAILDYGGFLGVGKRRIAVSWRALRFAPGEKTGTVSLLLGPEQLKAIPEFKTDGPIVAAAPPGPSPAGPEDAPPPPARD